MNTDTAHKKPLLSLRLADNTFTCRKEWWIPRFVYGMVLRRIEVINADEISLAGEAIKAQLPQVDDTAGESPDE